MRSRTGRGLGCNGVDQRPTEVDAEVEVGDEPATQVLGWEIGQRWLSGGLE
jgi:hypothetical protein